VNYSQTLFSLSTIDRYRAAQANERAAYFNTQSSRGLVVLTVGTAYLQALALGAQVDNARALLQADQVLLDQTIAEHQAGTAANLDELRARVQFQSQQQSVIEAEVDFKKAKIALNREIGLPAEQEIQLTDAEPYAELAEMNIDEARQIAYQSRQDYQGLQAQIRSAELQRRAAKWERLPTLVFQGNYGVTGVTGGLYHGTFVAQGSLNLPLFQEAKFRGDSGVAAANLTNLTEQMASLKEQINQQLRDSILDVQSATELVRVAQSNVELARKELEQTTDRFQAGVDDNLPVVQAQATLANAETTLVNTTSQHNQAKLGLARNLGIVDTQYATYLHGN
jgi:outer membrane protein TolC